MLSTVAVMLDDEPLAAGVAALESADWDGAKLAFETALARAEDPEALRLRTPSLARMRLT